MVLRSPRRDLYQESSGPVGASPARDRGPTATRGDARCVESTGVEENRHESTPILFNAALAYARRGVPVFPCEPGGKRPLTYSGFWDATTDPRRIRGWWGRWPTANVGVPTGERSDLLVLDVDPRGDGFESLAVLERKNGPLPKTSRARTGGGGVHVFFRYPAGETVRNSAGTLGSGLDVRGEGGYVVVPPSRTQSAYEWIDRSPPTEAAWLLMRLNQEDDATLF
jgi:hypothetical protein